MQKKYSMFAVAIMSLLTLALGCGGDDDGGKVLIPDAPTGGGSADAAAANCYIASSYAPTFGTDDQFAEYDGTGADEVQTWGALLSQDTPPDIIQLELYAGIGAFPTGITPKSVTITGAELNYATCSVCVRIFADAQQNAPAAAQYLATGGTVELTSTSGNLTGTLTNVTLEKVTVAQDYTSTPVGDGCTTTITSASFSAPLEMAMGATAGDPSARIVASPRVTVTRRTR